MSRDLELYHMVETNQLTVEEALELVEKEAKEFNGTPDAVVLARIKELGGHRTVVATVQEVQAAVERDFPLPSDEVPVEIVVEDAFYPADEEIDPNSLTDTSMVEETQPAELPEEEAVVTVEPEGETLAEEVAPVEPEAEVAEEVSEVVPEAVVTEEVAVEPEAQPSETPLM